MAGKEIPKDINVLLLIHPRDPRPETEYALDQFVLRGGKLIAFVDPYAYFDQSPTMPGMPPQQGSSSSLPTLFKAWGVEYDSNKVISDVVFGSGGGARYTPTVLSLNRTALSRDDVVTGSIETLLYAFGGAFQLKPVEGLKATDLVHSSPNSMLVDNADATKSGDQATRSFKPSGKALPLAVRLTGKFKTAFPNGKPEDKKDEDKKDEDKNKKPEEKKPEDSLKQSTADNSVILVADADFLGDGVAVQRVNTLFGPMLVERGGNLPFAQNAIEQLTGDSNLIAIRSERQRIDGRFRN